MTAQNSRMRRPSAQVLDSTRDALIEAATTVFAEHGYVGGSVRLITRAAGANQAAITYHFGGKDGLYRTVLRQAIMAFEEHSPITEESVTALAPEEAIRLVMRRFLSPLVEKDRLGRYVQIFGWESVHPTRIYTDFFAEERPGIFFAVDALVRRLLPQAHESRISLVAFWLIQQPIAFVRHAERLKQPPLNLAIDGDALDGLVDQLTALTLHGIRGIG
jgi:AcrR family transcriptional regulator